MSPSSLSELPVGDPSMLILPTELDSPDFSVFMNMGQLPLGPRFGLSSIMLLTLPLREGIAMLFWVMIGELSGDDSANVE